MTMHPIRARLDQRRNDRQIGVVSICSAHPMVIEAALSRAARRKTLVLIEATCNQVNHRGGYTGLTPVAFRAHVETIAAKVGLPIENLVLGGDHLGPNPWRHLPAEAAMAEAKTMIAAFAEAGFSKLHLDASMACADDSKLLSGEMIARRATSLATVAEATGARPVYVIGTEVPTPGGATAHEEELNVTRPEVARETLAIHKAVFHANGLEAAFERVCGLVVQPGVEFGQDSVAVYVSDRAQDLAAVLQNDAGLVFEAHSTDYQPKAQLTALVRDGFAILKVGPWLTFALREALYGLDAIAQAINPTRPKNLVATMDALMLARPDTWKPYCDGDADSQRLQRHYGYSDRIRYLWPDPVAGAAVDALLADLEAIAIPETLIGQFLARLHDRVIAGDIEPKPRALVRAAIDDVLDRYGEAASC